jgi:drug/metabolite transporter (DMT)-like permease
MLIASISFAWMNACVKYIDHIPIVEIIFIRATVTLIISYLILKKKGINPWGNHHNFLIARGFFGALGLLCYFYTLQQMALANAIVIHYLSPLFTTIIALLFLKESVRIIQWISFAVSITGVLMVKGFSNVTTFDFAIGVAGAFFTGLAYNAIRNMKGKEDADVIIFYQPLIALPFILLIMIIFPYQIKFPKAMDWFFLIGTGIFTQIGQYYITRAYQADSAARISSVSYIGIIWAVFIGKFLFNDSYPISVLTGMLIVLIGVFINLNALKVRQLADKIRAYFVWH